jgi:hypothetical protein
MNEEHITVETVELESINTGWDVYYDMMAKIKIPDGIGINCEDKVKITYKVEKV